MSETRINQHIRALKDFYAAGSLGDLVKNYRATLPVQKAEIVAVNDAAEAVPEGLLKPFNETVYIKSQVNGANDPADPLRRDDPGHLILGDAMPLLEQAPWLRPGEPRVVPGLLDGEHAVLVRLGVIVGIASGILAAVVLTVTAAVTLSEATEGKASVSVEQG